MGLTAILGVVMINTDIVLLGWLTDATSVGLFAAAQKPVTLLYSIPALIATAIFPALARFAQTDKKKFRLLIEKGLTAVLLFAFPITIGLLLAGKEIIQLLYGAEYLPAVITLQILSLTLITMSPINVLYNGVFAYDKQRFFVQIGVIGVTANAILDVILIPFLGIVGCAIATVFTQIITSVLIWSKMKQINDFKVLGDLKKIFIATLVMAGGVWVLLQTSLHILLIVTLAGLIYFGTLLLIREKLFTNLKTILAG